MSQEWQLFLMALAQLTRVTVPAAALRRPQWRHHSARHWPAVGLLVGAVGSAVLGTAAHLWPGPVAVLAAIATVVWLTRASGEAAFAAVFPAPAGSGVWLLLALRVAALQGLAARDLHAALAALPLAHALGCGAAVLLWHRMPEPPARADAPGLAVAAHADGALPAHAEVPAPGHADALAPVRADPPASVHADPAAGRRAGPSAPACAGATDPADPDVTARGVPVPAARVDALSLMLAAVWCGLAAAVASLFMPPTAWLAALAAAVVLALSLEKPLRRRCGGYREAAGAAVRSLAEVAALLAVLAVLAQG